ncbi:MAG TPA: hypothetical protein VGE08_05475 [Steroidobacter sp.]
MIGNTSWQVSLQRLLSSKSVHPREWFLVPFPVIDEAVARIRDGSITGMVYDPTKARLVAVR